MIQKIKCWLGFHDYSLQWSSYFRSYTTVKIKCHLCQKTIKKFAISEEDFLNAEDPRSGSVF